MANRVPIDLTDLRERIENARSDSAWRELSLSKKARILLQERLDQIEKEQSQMDSAQQDKPPASSTSAKGTGGLRQGEGGEG
jgi:hypothetical protein